MQFLTTSDCFGRKRKLERGFFALLFMPIFLMAAMAMVFVLPFTAFASPPASPYAPGETLNPTCSPGDANCTVVASLAGASTSTFVSFYLSSSTVGGDSSFVFNSSTKLLSIGTSTITSLSFTSASGTNIGLTGYLQAQNIFDFGGNKYITSTPAAGVTSAVSGTYISVSNATGSVTFNFVNPGFVTSASSVTWSAAQIFNAAQTFSATSTFGSSTIVNGQFVFGNASGTNVSSTNISATGYGLFPTLAYTNASGSNETLSGYLAVRGIATLSTTTVSTTLSIGTSTAVGNALLTIATSSNIFTVLSNGNVGVGTSSPATLFTVATSSNFFNVTAGGLVGISTSTPLGRLHIVGLASSTLTGTVTSSNPFGDLTVTGTSTTLFGTQLQVGDVISTPDQWRIVIAIGSATSALVNFPFNPPLSSATSVFVQAPILRAQDDLGNNALMVHANGVVTADQTQFGALMFPEDAGVVSWTDMSVSSTLASTPVGYSAQLDGNPVMTIYGESDGTGGVQNFRVGINTTNPLSLLTVVSSTPFTATGTLVFLGDGVAGTIIGGNASGTVLGINMSSSFIGDFENYQVNSSTKYVVNASGSLAIATGTQISGGLLTISTSTFIFGVNNSGNVLIATTTAAAGNALLTIATTTNILTILNNGRIGFGTSTFSTSTRFVVCAIGNCTLPTATSTVAQFASVDGTTGTASILARGNITGNSADYGEYVPVAGNAGDYDEGDLLSISSSTELFEKSRRVYDSGLAGVVTRHAAFIAGGENIESKVVMALAGRIIAKVTGENGPIVPGDLITAASLRGYGMKATKMGRVVGIALGSFDGATASETGTVLVFINPHWYAPAIAGDALQGSPAAAVALNVTTFDSSKVYAFKGIQTGQLEVGSAGAPAGITLYDRKTKQPYCLVVEDGAVKSVPGMCGEEGTNGTTGTGDTGTGQTTNDNGTAGTDNTGTTNGGSTSDGQTSDQQATSSTIDTTNASTTTDTNASSTTTGTTDTGTLGTTSSTSGSSNGDVAAPDTSDTTNTTEQVNP